MAELPKLTLADQALANAIYCIAGMPLVDPAQDENTDMFVAIVTDLLFQVNRNHPYVEVLAQAGEEIRDAYADKDHEYCNRAYQAARRATRHFAHWRLGEAMELLNYGGRAA
ncbi:hypothetical protein [Pacificibacter marinus]|uniref:hypothetical protein n=1 Tax=Pacificibacter marinus TaxID=658057 RepID=UPI001C07A256|nr:hypothetical protein [Pacificibacter marinus]MBU2867034.1 hypothetical protein [Pacificibacter marinus]